ncbi:Serine/threonine-protein kinase psk1 [Penicillium argentinense]|uniref:Serine/threonine-protein kinase psk1 n=1 Tax=Penicillium argentinense TaxID=1131581 RepID=A0A9W9FPE2_9EURO|nr:Serine/threonine-protein kinase psk1 [Penicillium argentinense]KAJ5104016.1 Serine/threonine-protein kinase psk1 [Penicillium argentinense]
MSPSEVTDEVSVGDVFTPQADNAPPAVDVSANHHGADVHMGERRFSPDTHLATENAIRAYGLNKEKEMLPSALPALMTGKQRRKKKKKQAAAAAADPALSTVRGFTPLASGDEDSDFSTSSSRATYSRPATAIGGVSPPVYPSTGHGVSALKLQLDSLNISGKPTTNTSGLCSATPSNASVYSDSDQTEVLTSYEVPLEHDFVSADVEKEDSITPSSPCAVGNGNGTDMRSQLCRKMTADDFEPLLCLGKGSFGTVLLVRHVVTGKLYAQKQFRKASITVHKKLVEQTKTERMVLESVNRHPFVVKLFYAFQDHEKLYLILEYAQGGELFHHLAMERMFEEDAAAFYMAEMVLALEHLHQNVGVLYRDLKPENCLLDREGHLLLTDFGLSKIALSDDDRCNSSLGTIEYMAPEVIQGKPYGKACDWWSLGALGFDLLTGSPPFRAANHAKLQEKIVKQKLVLPYFIGPDAKDLLIRLLRKEPAKRLGYHMPKDLQTIKKHRFFRKIDWAALERRELTPPIQPVVTDPALAENFSSDFTQIPLSPTFAGGFDDLYESGRKASRLSGIAGQTPGEGDPFGGFSFVASSSLLDHGLGLMTAGV